MKTIKCITKPVMTALTIFCVLLLPSIVYAADDFSKCSCTAPYPWGKNLTVCIDATNYTVALSGCDWMVGDSTKVCDIAGQQYRVTTIKKICFVGGAPAMWNCANDAFIKKLYNAIECTMVQCNPPGQWGNQVPAIPNKVWTWTMLFPRCISCNATGPCFEACGNAPCCAVSYKWITNMLSQCSLNSITRCSDDTDCTPGAGCLEVTCPTTDPSCCGH